MVDFAVMELTPPDPWICLVRGSSREPELGILNRNFGLLIFLMSIFDLENIKNIEDLFEKPYIRYATWEDAEQDGWRLD